MTPSPPPSPRKRPQVALWVFLGVLVLAVGGSVAAATAINAKAEKPADVARAYLEALAAGNAAQAISYTSAAPVDQTLLTDAVLADSQQRAPLTGITVSADSASDEAVDVAYSLGDHPVTDHYTLSRVSGRWKLDQVSARVDFMPVIDARVPVVVNGTPVDTQQTEAFPVSYVVTTGLSGVDWGENSATTVSLDRGAESFDLEPRLTARGRSEFVSGARKAIGACVSQHDLAPDDCPFGFRQPTSGPRIPNSTVRWTVKGNPWKNLPDPEIDTNDPGTARTHVSMTFTNTCRYSTGQACKAEDQTREVYFRGDVTAEPIKVALSAY